MGMITISLVRFPLLLEKIPERIIANLKQCWLRFRNNSFKVTNKTNLRLSSVSKTGIWAVNVDKDLNLLVEGINLISLGCIELDQCSSLRWSTISSRCNVLEQKGHVLELTCTSCSWMDNIFLSLNEEEHLRHWCLGLHVLRARCVFRRSKLPNLLPQLEH